jgi:hypothetical protein
MPRQILVECGELDDFEVEELSRFLRSDSHITDVSLAPFESTAPQQRNGQIEINASIEPFYLAIRFAHSHWKEGAEVYAATKSTIDAFDYLTKQLKAWSESRASRYVACPILLCRSDS